MRHIGLFLLFCTLWVDVWADQTQASFSAALSAIEDSRKENITEDERKVLLDRAIKILHSMLVDRPALVRVRLELARAFFYTGEYALSKKHFERALSSSLPAEVESKVHRFLTEIRARKRWSIRTSVALAPSTNIGRYSDSEIIHIHGFPFRREKEDTSGVGLVLWTSSEYRKPLSERIQLRMGNHIARQEYSAKKFDQMNVYAYAGPFWQVNDLTSIDLALDAGRSWFGGTPYYDDIGIRAQIHHRLTPRITLNGKTAWRDRKYRIHDSLNGPVTNVSLKGTWALPTIMTELSAGYEKERADGELWRNDTWWGGVSVFMAMPKGFTLGGSFRHLETDYEGNWFPYTDGSSRKDDTRIWRASIHRRAFTLWGFSPQLVLSYEERQTNAQVYDYDRAGGELRFVRQF